MVLGSALFLAAVSTAFILPVHDDNDQDADNGGGTLSIEHFLNNVRIIIIRFYILSL